jgi:transcriptional regulator with XRE-family HTH domain
MIIFKKREIKENQELISQELKRIREEKGLELAKVALDLQISEKYLKSLEVGDVDKLPEGVYGKNFLKKYAEYLGLEPDKIAQEYFNTEKNIKKDNKELFVRKVPGAIYFMTIPRILRNALLFSLALVLFAYLGYAVYNIISPPLLIIYSPEIDFQTNERSLSVVGQSEPETNVLINEESVLINDDGSFEKKVNLQVGINSIVISAQKKYSRIKYITRKVLVEVEK